MNRIMCFNDEGLDCPSTFCCDSIKYQLTSTCRGADRHTTGTEQCPDQVICYNRKYREYSISPVMLPSYLIKYCPFCGTQFPESLRDKWFDTLISKGFDGDALIDEESIPEEFKTDEWWKHLPLEGVESQS